MKTYNEVGMRKKICIITSMIYPVPAIRGGAVEGLVELLVRMNEKYNRLDLTVISVYDSEAKKEAQKYKNTRFIFVNRNGKLDSFFSKKIFIYVNKIAMKFKGRTLIAMPFVKNALQMIENESFDKYVLEGGGDCYNFGYLHKKIMSDKLYVHFHGEVIGEKAIQSWFGRCITVSNFIARRLVCNGCVDSEKVYVLPNCYDQQSMQTNISRIEIRNKYGIEDNEIVFVYWGRILPEKGVYDLILAYQKMGKNRENTRLLIIGNANFGYSTYSDYDKKIEQICSDKSIQDRVIFTGFVPHDEIGSILAACDIGVIPSIWDDPAPLTVFEGLAKGLPLIAGAVGGIPEIIKDGENGVLVSWSTQYADCLAKKMIELKDNNKLRVQLSKSAFESIKEYTPDKYYDRYVQLME